MRHHAQTGTISCRSETHPVLKRDFSLAMFALSWRQDMPAKTVFK
jgi:hypothetical protein